MHAEVRAALAAGSERLAAWADLLDEINVFPVADGDTGRNLLISLLPLRRLDVATPALREELLLSARGNSGNIAARFFSGWLEDALERTQLGAAARRGRELAWRAVAEPRAGTMLSLFDALDEALAAAPAGDDAALLGPVLDRLEAAVRETRETLPKLRAAGVVDAGALGMFIFFDGFFHALAGRAEEGRPVAERFREGLRLPEGFAGEREAGYCVDAVVQAADADGLAARAGELGESVVAISQGGYLKLHLHTDDRDATRARLAGLGALVHFDSDDMSAQADGFARHAGAGPRVHVLCDAAGSVTRSDARALGLGLLDSYVLLDGRALPETHVRQEELYAAMRRGEKVSTSQASLRERHLCYQKALGLHPRVLYVSVGSVFTGNFQVASDWRRAADPEGRMCVLDSGSASGRLGMAVLSTGRRAAAGEEAEAVEAHARWAVDKAEELLFLDQLKFLAAGGRLGRTSAFFGDLLHMKPVVSPRPDGARKVGVLRAREDQRRFARERLLAAAAADGPLWIMAEYTDNLAWVEGELAPELRAALPGSELFLQPLSLTTGTHTGPGTWGVAWLPLRARPVG
jgi:uncharacterized protein